MEIDYVLADIAQAQRYALNGHEFELVEQHAVNLVIARLPQRPFLRDLFDQGNIVEVEPIGELFVARERLNIDEIGGCLKIAAIFPEASLDLAVEKIEADQRTFEAIDRVVADLSPGADHGIGSARRLPH